MIDPDTVLRRRIVEFVGAGDFGLASGDKGGGEYERLWFREPVGADEVAFESGVFLLARTKAEQLRATPEGPPVDPPVPSKPPVPPKPPIPPNPPQKATLRLKGTVPPEVWNRLGTRILPKLRSGDDLSVGVEFSVSVDAGLSQGFQLELEQALEVWPKSGRKGLYSWQSMMGESGHAGRAI